MSPTAATKAAPAVRSDEHVRRQRLIECVERVRRLNAAYTNSPESVTAPPREFHEALIEMFREYGLAYVPSSMQPLAARVEALAIEYTSHVDRCVTRYVPILDPDLPRDFWGLAGAMYKALEDFLAPAALPQLESVQELLLEKVPPRQIASMLGLELIDVLAERDHPGSICGPGWRAPILDTIEKERAAAQLAQWSPSHLTSLANCCLRLTRLADEGLLDEVNHDRPPRRR